MADIKQIKAGNTTYDIWAAKATADKEGNDISVSLSRKMDDYWLDMYNGTGGNPKPVKFITVNYSTCGSETGVAIKLGMVSGHGNGSSYAFLQDTIIKVTYTGTVEVNNFKYYGQDTGTYDGANRKYGDIFWVNNTTSKIVDFYVLMGQYAHVQMTPWKRVTYSTGGTITQYTSCTVYSSGTKEWANNSEFATKATTLSGYGIADAYTKTEVDTKLSGKADTNHGTHVSYGTSATAVGSTASAGSASTVSRSDHTHSLSKSAVTTALGYTPPTQDTVYTHPTSHPASMITGLATVATSGSYNDLSNKPTIPAAYTHPTTTARTGVPTANQTPSFGGTFTVNQVSNDTNGHVSAITSRTITIPSTLSNGNSTAGLIKTSSTVTSNSGYTACPVISGVPYYKDTNSDTNTTYDLAASTSSTNGNVKLNLTAGGSGSGTDSVSIKGSGATTVTTDASGVITISSTDNNTTYGVATSSTLGLVKSGTDITVDSSGNVSVNDDSHNHVISNIDNLQTTLNAKASSSDLTSHTGNKSNPHGVTAAQAGALSTSGGTVSGNLTVTGNFTLGGVSLTYDSTNKRMIISVS